MKKTAFLLYQTKMHTTDLLAYSSFLQIDHTLDIHLKPPSSENSTQ